MSLAPRPRQLLYIDGNAGYGLGLDDSSIRVHRGARLARLVPIRTVERVILREPQSDTLQALLELIRHGVGVHVQDGNGRIVAALVRTEAQAEPWAQSLAWDICRAGRLEGYDTWRDVQLRHAASRIVRHNPRGPISAFEAALRRYAGRPMTPKQFAHLSGELRAQLFAWMDDLLRRRGWTCLCDALTERGHCLREDLERCLMIPALWALTPLAREQNDIKIRELLALFERIRPKLEDALDRHVRMLAHHLHGHGALHRLNSVWQDEG